MTTKRFISLLLLAATFAHAQLDAIRTLTPEQGQEVRRPVEAQIFTSSQEELPALEKELLDIFQSSETTLEGKRYACRMLRYCASEACLPVLAPELANPDLSQFVRRVFQSLEIPSADSALISALPDASASITIGIIGTLGQRGLEDSIPAIVPYLENETAEIQFAAITTLGNIGGKKAYHALASAKVRPELSNSCKMAQLKSAAKITFRPFPLFNPAPAWKFYRPFLHDENEAIQCAAMVGFVDADPDEGTDLVLENLEGAGRFHATARGLLSALPTGELVDELDELDAANQILVISELSDRNANAAENSLLALTASGNEAVSEAAYRALGKVGGTKSIQPLLAVAGHNPVAYESLCALNAEDANVEILQALETATDDKVKVKLIECLAARQSKAALPQFVEMARGRWGRVCKAAIDGMPNLVAATDFTTYAELIRSTVEAKKMQALEQSAISAAQRLPDVDACAGPMIDAYAIAEGETRHAIIRVLGGIGGELARKQLTTSLASDDPQTKDAAIRGLANWPSLDATGQLLDIATGGGDEKQRVIALRGYIRLAYTETNPDRRIEMCRKAAAATDRPAELKNIIGCIKQVKEEPVLDFLAMQLDNPAVYTEAGWAICEISSHWKLKAPALPILQRIAQNPSDSKLAEEAAQRIRENES